MLLTGGGGEDGMGVFHTDRVHSRCHDSSHHVPVKLICADVTKGSVMQRQTHRDRHRHADTDTDTHKHRQMPSNTGQQRREGDTCNNTTQQLTTIDADH